MRSFALALLLFLTAQDAGRINLDREGSLPELAQALSDASGASLRVLDTVDPKPVRVQTTNATFFEALDALCRAHGKARYAEYPKGPDEGTLELRPGPFADYPSSYTPDAKVIVSEVCTFTAATSVGEQRWSRIYLSLFGAPWLRVQETAGAKAFWILEEALDADGKDLLVPARDPEPAQSVDLVWHPRFFKANTASKMFRVRSFDPDRGLQILKGSVSLSVSGTKEVELPLAAGKSVETTAGTLTVDAVREPEQTSTGTVWRVGLTLKEKRNIISLKQAIEGRFRCDGDELKNRVFLLTLPKDGFTFEAVIRGATTLPASMRIQVRDGDRRATIPFEFKNVRF